MSEISLQQALASAAHCYQANRLPEAEAWCRQILANIPNQPDANNLLALLAQRAGYLSEAVALLRQAIAANPCAADYHSNLGMILAKQNDLSAAIVSLNTALQLNPRHPDAGLTLGNVLFMQGKFEHAIKEYEQILQFDPKSSVPAENLGTALLAAGRTADAIRALRRASELAPERDSALRTLGTALTKNAEFDEAIAVAHRAAQLLPQSPQVQIELGNALRNRLHLSQARQAYQRAINLDPSSVDAHVNLGGVLRSLRLREDAERVLRRAIELDPNSAEAHNNLGNVLRDASRIDEAEASFRRALQLKPDLVQGLNNLGGLLKDRALLDEAITCFREAIRLAPNFHDAWSNLLYTLNFHLRYDGAAILGEHARWRERIARPVSVSNKSFPHDHDSERRLRIGYVSPDLRDHVVGRNLLPLLRNHDHSRYEIFCYSDAFSPDQITSEFKSCADHWRETFGLTNAELAEHIRQDQIDILVDLTLHMAGNRLMVFAQRPAPVQMTFAGYPGTTGLTTIQFRITDSLLDPPGLNDASYSEESLRLKGCYWSYDPLAEEPSVAPLPSRSNGYITFGCLNNFCKVNHGVLQTWAQILEGVPESCLLILAEGGATQEWVLKQLSLINADRIAFVAKRERQFYLQYFHQIDIALDTFPYNGHTTSLDGLWMGVPTVTLAGTTAVGRAGVSQLSRLGLENLIASSAAEYVQIAQRLAQDRERLQRLRSSLRESLRASSITDAASFALDVESLYREAWRRWCLGLK
jgi:predicted O-linked N-acetylglucosamine transferase (SPINDLY family)